MKRLLASAAALSLALAAPGPCFAQAQSAPAEAVPASAPPPAAAPIPFADTIIPPPSRTRPAARTDEAGLWDVSDRAEQEARNSGELEHDPALNTYLRGVACKVAAADCGNIRLYVMNRPLFNAQMAPNGYMEVWSGLLLRSENEAQLAFVLGHEITHFSENHSVIALREAKSRANAAMLLSITIAVATTAAAVNSPGSAQSITNIGRGAMDVVYLGAVASMFGFSRELETAADAQGFNRAVAAGYDPQAGVALWNNLRAEAQASDNLETRHKDARASIFASHPLSADRIEALTTLAQAHPASGETFRARYRAMIRPHLDSWLRAEIRRRDAGETLVLLDHLDNDGEDLGLIEFYRGEVYRLRRQDGDFALAEARYTAAIAQPDAPARAYRERGDLRARDGDRAGAAQDLTAYLERAPAAEDRLLVEARITQLNAGGNP